MYQSAYLIHDSIDDETIAIYQKIEDTHSARNGYPLSLGIYVAGILAKFVFICQHVFCEVVHSKPQCFFVNVKVRAVLWISSIFIFKAAS